MKRLFAIPAIALLVTALAGCGSKPQTLSGNLVIPATYDSNVRWAASRGELDRNCTGFDARLNWKDGALASLRQGSPIVVKNDSGKVIATSLLENGVSKDLSPSGACVLPFTIAELPSSEFYTIEVENIKGTFPMKTFQSKNWKVQIQVPIDSPTILDGSSLASATEKEKRQLKVSADLATAVAPLRTKSP
jgi:hypothetical protein